MTSITELAALYLDIILKGKRTEISQTEIHNKAKTAIPTKNT